MSEKTISQTTGPDTLLFSYDAKGKAVSVRHIHTEENNTLTTNDYYYLRNAQSDIVKIIDGTGVTVVEYSYDSWGRQLNCTGSLSATLGTLNPLRYRGYVYDDEAVWYYLQSRYYDPEVGRFISADMYLSTGQGVLGCNSYCYCGNNPNDRADRIGNFFFTIVGAIAGAISGGVTAALKGESVIGGVLSGAASGAVAGAGMDIVAATSAASIPAIIIVTGAGMLSGLADEAIDDYFDDGKHSLSDYIVSTTVGGLFNLIGYGMAGNSNALKNTIKNARSFAQKVARKGFTHSLRKKAFKFAIENIAMKTMGDHTVTPYKRYANVIREELQ